MSKVYLVERIHINFDGKVEDAIIPIGVFASREGAEACARKNNLDNTRGYNGYIGELLDAYFSDGMAEGDVEAIKAVVGAENVEVGQADDGNERVVSIHVPDSVSDEDRLKVLDIIGYWYSVSETELQP